MSAYLGAFLQVLDAHACQKLTKVSLASVATLSGLSALHIGSWDISEADMRTLAKLPLQRVQLSSGITSAFLQEASDHFVGSAWSELAEAAAVAERQATAGAPFLGQGHSTLRPVWWGKDCSVWSRVEDAFGLPLQP